ncbi:MAG: hypothetical protein DLM62_02090 [Pseudonocardiales bacterium]|nr:MAG: hypothetical protein DLM62_02090 [Pseudonocardiales bacterium]
MILIPLTLVVVVLITARGDQGRADDDHPVTGATRAVISRRGVVRVERVDIADRCWPYQVQDRC